MAEAEGKRSWLGALFWGVALALFGAWLYEKIKLWLSRRKADGGAQSPGGVVIPFPNTQQPGPYNAGTMADEASYDGGCGCGGAKGKCGCC